MVAPSDVNTSESKQQPQQERRAAWIFHITANNYLHAAHRLLSSTTHSITLLYSCHKLSSRVATAAFQDGLHRGELSTASYCSFLCQLADGSYSSCAPPKFALPAGSHRQERVSQKSLNHREMCVQSRSRGCLRQLPSSTSWAHRVRSMYPRTLDDC